MEAGFDLSDLQFSTPPNQGLIISWQEDVRKYCLRDQETGKLYEEKDWENPGEEYPTPKVGIFVPFQIHGEVYGDNDRRYWPGMWRVIGAVLIQSRKNKQFLCSLDERTYFVAQLSKHCSTVAQAFKSLRPAPVRKAIGQGLEVLRQGEWFFVPTGICGLHAMSDFVPTETITEMRELAKQKSLPYRNKGNHHDCKHFSVKRGKVTTTYAFGKVYHRWPWGGLTGQHKTLNLGEEWHRVYHNTEIKK